MTKSSTEKEAGILSSNPGASSIFDVEKNPPSPTAGLGAVSQIDLLAFDCTGRCVIGSVWPITLGLAIVRDRHDFRYFIFRADYGRSSRSN